MLTTILFTIVCQNNTQPPEIETSTPQFVQIVKKEAKIEKLKPDFIEGEDYNGMVEPIPMDLLGTVSPLVFT